MVLQLVERARDRFHTCVIAVRRRLLRWSRPAASTSLVLGATTDLLRSRSELVAENALLRQQLIVLGRTATRPRLTRADWPLQVRRGAVRLADQPLHLLRACPDRQHPVARPGAGGGRRTPLRPAVLVFAFVLLMRY